MRRGDHGGGEVSADRQYRGFQAMPVSTDLQKCITRHRAQTHG